MEQNERDNNQKRNSYQRNSGAASVNGINRNNTDTRRASADTRSQEPSQRSYTARNDKPESEHIHKKETSKKSGFRAASAKKSASGLITKEAAFSRFMKFLRNEDDTLAPSDIVRIKGGVDRPMLVIIILLICFGSVMVFSASYAYALSRYGNSYYFIRRHLIFVAGGVGVMMFVTLFDYRTIRRFTNLYYLFCVAMLVVVLVIGLAQGQAKRWISIGGFFTVQPSELMKLGIVLVLANYYYKRESQVASKNFWVSSIAGTFIPVIILAFSCGLIALENHISGTIILFLIGMVVIFVAGAKKIWIAAAAGAAGIGVSAIIFMTDYATKRLDMWLHPENYSTQGDIWQTIQGLYAVGSGGLFGVGLGNGRQKMLFVSMPQNDFIYSILCEELGFVGAVMVIILFALFVWRGFKIAQRTPDTFSRLTVIGITSKVAIQALLNIAVVTGSIPNTGISLPFFSYGGSSLLMLMAEMGVLLAISRYSSSQK